MLSAIFLSVSLMAGPSPDHERAPQWQAAMCKTGTYYHPRFYASKCELSYTDPRRFCSERQTQFMLVTGPQNSKAGCLKVVRDNTPSHHRKFRSKRRPLVCDYNITGPMEAGCLWGEKDEDFY